MNFNPTEQLLKILTRSGVEIRVKSKFELEVLKAIGGICGEDYGYPKPDSFYRKFVEEKEEVVFGISCIEDKSRILKVIERLRKRGICGDIKINWMWCFSSCGGWDVDFSDVIGFSFNFILTSNDVIKLNNLLNPSIKKLDFTVPQNFPLISKLLQTANVTCTKFDDSLNLTSSGIYVISRIIGIRSSSSSINIYIDEGRYGSLNGLIKKVRVIQSDGKSYEKIRTKIWGPTCDVIDKVWEGDLEVVKVGDWVWFDVEGVGGGTGFNGFNVEGSEGEVVVRGWERNWREEEM